MLSNQSKAKPLSKMDATELAAAIKSSNIRGKIRMFNIVLSKLHSLFFF